MGIVSLVQCEGVTQLASGFILEGITLCVAVYSLWKERNSGAYYADILVWSLIFILLLVCLFSPEGFSFASLSLSVLL